MDLKKLLQSSPFHRLLGLKWISSNMNEVVLGVDYKKELDGSDEGVNIHGGVIASLIDVSACFAMMNAIGGDAPNMNLEVHYTLMAASGDSLKATAKTLKVGRTIGIADVIVTNQDGKLIAVGRSTLANAAPSRDKLTK
ncbi:Phenylacetic acid degradation-like protein [Croceitalea dokdonensis DOKDO 023]|uniref:Phenylacetic acid degradation-like protein n=1 Tax=Croceitalea dokdonensis DOKDO 023 TaxID=1300341 RepID=A0A0P7A5Y3_9FLAO|nr:PaaI family thioesterase [Croceitalea dokdonensis]KPM32055.1 Phenylacetic acid degradation-like protein [Croceitalea dokdonensis DOKDO 023]